MRIDKEELATELKKLKPITSWSDMYVDTLEEIYGPFNLHPALSTVDLCKEWSDVFGLEGRFKAANDEMALIRSWSDSYMETVESLYGAIDLHPKLSIEEVCEEWKACFRQDASSPAEIARLKALKEWTEDYLHTWSLQSAS